MNELKNKNWHTGSKKSIDFSEIRTIVNSYVKQGAKIYVGSDSFITQESMFRVDRRDYFFYREKHISSHYVNLF